MNCSAQTATAGAFGKISRRLVLCLAMLVVLVVLPNRARAEEPPVELIQRAAAAQDHQAELYAQVIGREVELAKQDYDAGKLQEATTDVASIGTYGDKLLAAAKEHPKHLKQAEIKLREDSRRLHELEQTLDLDQRPPVKQAVEKLEQIRAELLQLMFAPPRH